MFQRHKLEKEEGKSYNDADVSAEMKALNKKFSQVSMCKCGKRVEGIWNSVQTQS